MKDYFSTQSKAYATFRPTYPKELYGFILQHVRNKGNAWDCATGNGQVARYLARYFDKVHATDISQKQLAHAHKKDNIFYSVSSAEKTPFDDSQFDLVTVAQALHWFDRDLFFDEAKRVSKPGAILAVWGYSLLYIDPVLDSLIMEFYKDVVGPYWDDARKLVEEEYRTITFPFEEIPAPSFRIQLKWTLDQLSGYLSSWSATQKYIKKREHDPVSPWIRKLNEHWTQPIMTVTFPVFLRVGKITK